MEDVVKILGVNINRIGINDIVNKIEKMIQSDKFNSVFTPNSEIIMSAYKDKELLNIINNADLLTADGIGVVYAAKIFGKPVPQRAAGYDVSKKLMEIMAEKGYTLYLFGSAPGVARKAKENLENEYKTLKIIGLHDGYFDSEEEKNIIEGINSLKLDVLFVCLGSPKQEKWIYNNRNNLNVKVAMGLGGCLDVYAGNVKRAPEIYIKLGLEWLYRLIKEPKRLFRMMALPKFMITVILKKIFGGN